MCMYVYSCVPTCVYDFSSCLIVLLIVLLLLVSRDNPQVLLVLLGIQTMTEHLRK